MGEFLARIRFPEGREIYARYSSSSATITEGLYESYAPAGERDEGGFIRDRDFIPAGYAPLPHRPELPLSAPEDLIAVRVTQEGCGWTALFCPLRNELIGPLRPFFAEDLQQNFDLLRRKDRLHLKPDKAAETLCGEAAAGEAAPFRYFEGLGVVDPDPPPPRRDLFEEWNGGEVCRRCLLEALLTRKLWSW